MQQPDVNNDAMLAAGMDVAEHTRPKDFETWRVNHVLGVGCDAATSVIAFIFNEVMEVTQETTSTIHVGVTVATWEVTYHLYSD
jgi:hypothetical protein